MNCMKDAVIIEEIKVGFTNSSVCGTLVKITFVRMIGI